MDKLCKRTRCLCRPGEPQPGCHCRYSWDGKIPCTGRLICTMCGEETRNDQTETTPMDGCRGPPAEEHGGQDACASDRAPAAALRGSHPAIRDNRRHLAARL